MANTVEIGAAEIQKATSDANFFRVLPEFASLQVKMDTMKNASKEGCTPCKMRRMVGSVNADFMNILPTLSDDGNTRLKKYFGADSIRYTKVDRIARKTVTVTI